MNGKRILIIGATSAMAEATARIWAARGCKMYLLARNATRLEAIALDLRVRGAEAVHTGVFDALDTPKLGQAIDKAWEIMDGIDIALIAHGTLPDQTRCETDTAYAMREFSINGTATIALATTIAQKFETQGHGVLAVISSVAGDRGRASNYLYGSAKAAVSTHLSGLRQRLHGRGICILTIKPGFVDTPMTAAFRKSVLWATPAHVARGIVRAVERRRAVVYLPWFWRVIMTVIRHIPEFVFQRIKL